MASLNKARFKHTALIIASTFLLVLFSGTLIAENSFLHHALDFFGCLLIAICAVGRVYCTAFLGGFKNYKIINYGPFAVCRNPLYFFSFVGVCGISLLTNQVLVMIFTPAAFLAVYIPLIKREEEYLEQTFGKEYIKYKKTTPRFFPNLKLYHAPTEVQMRPKALLSAAKDSLMWFFIFPLMELIEIVQKYEIIKPLFYLP